MEIVTTQQELLKVIKLTKAFIGRASQRPILQAVHIEAAENGVITFVATDSYKLIKYELEAPAATIKSVGNCNIDIVQLEKILKIFKYKRPVEINLTTNETKLIVSFEGYSFTLFLILGKYPNVENVIPAKEEYITEFVRLSKVNLLPIIKAVENNGFVDIYINKNKNRACLLELVSPITENKATAIILPVRNI